MNFLAMDFETANHQRHSACSLALVMVRDSTIVGEYYSLIQPETPFFGAIFKYMEFSQQMSNQLPNFQKFGKSSHNTLIHIA